MANRSYLINTWLLIFAAVAFAQSKPGERVTDKSITAKVDDVFARFDKPDSPGCALGVIKDGQIVYKRGYGLSNLEDGVSISPSSIFHVASISKQFTAMAIVLLAQQGKLSLDDDVRKYVTEVPDFGDRITIRQLIHHTSGLRDQWSLLELAGWREDDVITEGDILELVARQKELNFKPGTEHLYCNTGYTLLAVIVKRVTGQSLREFANANIFKPLGMTSTHFHDDHSMIVKGRTSAYQPKKAGGLKVSIPVFDTYGATSLFTTVEDLAKWDQNFVDKKVGGEAAINQMLAVGVLNNGEKLNYAFGLSVGVYKGLKTVGHGGADAGYRADFLRFPEQRFSVTCLCNLSTSNPGTLTRKVADIYLADLLQTPTPKPGAPTSTGSYKASEQELQRKAGLYRDPLTEDTIKLEFKDGKLVAAIGPGFPLSPTSATEFTVIGAPVKVTFETSADGSTKRMVTRNDGGDKPRVYEAVIAPAPTASQLTQYAGRYYSEELDTSYTFATKDGKLTLHRKKFEDAALTPAAVDSFRDAELGTIKFTRNAKNEVTGFALFAGRVRNLKFARQTD
jgi:CubicO group peptidase (beta-lactamase class C family)